MLRLRPNLTLLLSVWLSQNALAISPPNPTNIYINEISTTGTWVFLDEDGEQQDWIEIYNPTGAAVSLAGWYLTDATDNLVRWGFPNVSIQPGAHLVVFASEKNRRPTDGSNLHTDFLLDTEGEYLAIVDSSTAVVNELFPEFPEQRVGFSFGYDDVAGAYRYMYPTPGAANDTTDTFERILENRVDFSVPRGHYDAPFTVQLSTLEPGADIRYTTDGSTPGWATGTLYSTPIPATTTIRAIALIPGVGLSDVVTHTYIFDFPDQLKRMPTLSLVTDDKHLEGRPLGITYSENTNYRGLAWERPISVEYFDPAGGPDFQIDCGIRVHGKGSRGADKKSFRLYFRGSHGQDELDFPLVPESDVHVFKRLVLRGGSNDLNPFVHDEMARRLLFDMGHDSSRGTFVQLFINGEYTGYYNPCERLDRYFFESWRGGGMDWDVIREGGEVDDGDGVVFNEILAIAQAAIDSGTLPDAQLSQIEDRLDLINFVDYLLLNLSSGMNDWPHNNWAAAREKVFDSKFRYYEWDAEQTFGIGISPRTDLVETKFAQGGYDPQNPIRRTYLGLRENPRFDRLFASRFRRQFYEDGGMTDTNQMVRFLSLRHQMVGSIPNMTSRITVGYVPGRRHCFEQHLDHAGLLDRTGLPLGRKLAINEFMASNLATISDEEDDFDDWIEIYNPTETAVDLSGMFLSDNFTMPTKWEFPAGTLLDPFDYLLVWADGQPLDGPLHASFKLDADGERIGLYDTLANGNALLDSVVFGEQTDDVSMGRRPDGYSRFRPLAAPSPGSSNGADPFTAIPGSASEEYAVEPGGRSIVAADFDKDNHPDLAYSNFDFGTISILMNRGDGTFESPVIRTTGRLGTTALAVGDFDGNGYTDLAAANDVMLEHSVSVFLNDGSGGLSLHGTALFNTAEETKHLHPRSLLARDVDGDDDLDLVVQNESYVLPVANILCLLTNDGDGNFTQAGSVAVGLADLTSQQALVAEDLDGDGDVDLATFFTVSILPVTTRQLMVVLNDGAGGFGTPIELPIPLNPRPISLVGGDLDGDGDVDLVTCDGQAGGGDVHVYLNDGAAGFAEAPDLHRKLAAPVNLLAEDFNSDGDRDIVAVNYVVQLGSRASLQILSNNGVGSFEVADEFFTSPVDPFPNSMTSGDFNADGSADLAVLDEFNGLLTVFMNVRQLGPPASSVAHWELLR